MLQKEGLWIRNQMHSLATCVHRFHMIPKEVSQGYACQGFWFWFCWLVLPILFPCLSISICPSSITLTRNLQPRFSCLNKLHMQVLSFERKKVPRTHSNSSLLIDIWLHCVCVFVFACKPCKSMRQERWTNKESEKNVWRHMRGGE